MDVAITPREWYRYEEQSVSIRQPKARDGVARGPSGWHGKGMSARQEQTETGSKDLVVFAILRTSKCTECGSELAPGDFLVMDQQRPLCLACADLDHLVFLPRGDTALTRRARNHSRLFAVVVRFSRARRRYERQGVLVEEDGLNSAEEECLGDADLRARHRERDQVRRAEEDHALVERMAAAIRKLFPACPASEARQIAQHTAIRGSGRVGRTAAGKDLEESALTAAVIAHIRHRHTHYDELLMAGHSREDARHCVRDVIDGVLDRWRRTGVPEP